MMYDDGDFALGAAAAHSNVRATPHGEIVRYDGRDDARLLLYRHHAYSPCSHTGAEI